MTIPTNQELHAAQDAIRREGPGAQYTIELGLLCLRDPLARGVCQNIAAASGVELGVVIGAFIAGLNLGLHLVEKRQAAA